MKKLWRFNGGIKLPGFKSLSNKSGIQPLDLPKLLVLPLRQHIGEPAEPVVSVGDYVFKGQLIATPSTYISAPIHASSSGTVMAIEKHVVPHQSGIAEPCIIIETDGKDEWDPAIRYESQPELLANAELLSRIRLAGIVGLGGAVFPSAAKLKPPRVIDTLIINGVECEPYITCDDVLMRSRPEDIIQGILLLRRLIQPTECIIAIEDNKPEAAKILNATLEEFRKNGIGSVNTISVVSVPTIFPAGGEKQLIKVLTGKEVAQQGLPYEVGVVCLNVGTTAAIYDAVVHGKPLLSRIVTVTGEQIKQPANYEVLIGTPVENLIRAAGGVKSENYKLIMGGPMMGQLLPDSKVPVTKATNCVLANNKIEEHKNVMPCIRCGSCATVCPMNLLPQQLYWYSRAKNFDHLAHYNLADCIECGCCSVVCPSSIPLVHYFRFAKTELREHTDKKHFADMSRVRTQAREERLARIKMEQEERKAKRKAARKRGKQSASPEQNSPAEKQISNG